MSGAMLYEKETAFYVHLPFCRCRCDYCDFYSERGRHPGNAYFEALTAQADSLCRAYSLSSFYTLYLGGGTPSMASPSSLKILFGWVKAFEGGALPGEITMECNPEDVCLSSLEDWKSLGISRLSMGVQSFQDEFLKRAGRKSSRKEIFQALDSIKQASARGVNFNLNLDIIQGLPGMSLEDQLNDLQQALSFNPGHISWYTLTLAEGTVLYEQWKQRITGREGDAEEVWLAGCALLEEAGYRRYEVSNFALPGRESRHNKAYWEMRPYLGCGPSAVSMLPRLNGEICRFRTSGNTAAFEKGVFHYCEEEVLSREEFLKDFLLMGLRLAQGIELKRFEKLFEVSLPNLFPKTLEYWCSRGILLLDEARLKAGRGGLDLLNPILVSFFEELDAYCISGGKI